VDRNASFNQKCAPPLGSSGFVQVIKESFYVLCRYEGFILHHFVFIFKVGRVPVLCPDYGIETGSNTNMLCKVK
jgi:hypothetical protein